MLIPGVTEINDVILTHRHYIIWNLGELTAVGAKSQKINGIVHFVGGALGEKATAQLGVLQLLNTKLMLSLEPVQFRFYCL